MATPPQVRTWPSRVGLSFSLTRRWRLDRLPVRDQHRPSSASVSTSASSVVGIPYPTPLPFVVSYLYCRNVFAGGESGLYVVVREQRAFGIQPLTEELLSKELLWHAAPEYLQVLWPHASYLVGANQHLLPVLSTVPYLMEEPALATWCREKHLLSLGGYQGREDTVVVHVRDSPGLVDDEQVNRVAPRGSLNCWQGFDDRAVRKLQTCHAPGVCREWIACHLIQASGFLKDKFCLSLAGRHAEHGRARLGQRLVDGKHSTYRALARLPTAAENLARVLASK